MDWLRHSGNEKIIDGWDKNILKKAMKLEHDKIKLLSDIPSLVDFFFVKDVDYKEEAVSKTLLSEKAKDSAKTVLAESAERLALQQDFSAEALEKYARELAAEKGLGTGKVFHPIRVAVSGRTQGPSLFHMMELMGKDETVRRIKNCVKKYFSA